MQACQEPHWGPATDAFLASYRCQPTPSVIHHYICLVCYKFAVVPSAFEVLPTELGAASPPPLSASLFSSGSETSCCSCCSCGRGCCCCDCGCGCCGGGRCGCGCAVLPFGAPAAVPAAAGCASSLRGPARDAGGAACGRASARGGGAGGRTRLSVGGFSVSCSATTAS